MANTSWIQAYICMEHVQVVCLVDSVVQLGVIMPPKSFVFTMIMHDFGKKELIHGEGDEIGEI